MQTMTPQMLDVVQLVHFSQTHGFEALKDTLEETSFFRVKCQGLFVFIVSEADSGRPHNWLIIPSGKLT